MPGRSQRAEFDLERRGAADFGLSAECFAAARQFDNGHGQAFIGAIRKKCETSGIVGERTPTHILLWGAGGGRDLVGGETRAWRDIGKQASARATPGGCCNKRSY